MKEIGEKNELTILEKEYFERQLGDGCTLGHQLGVSGQGTSAYLLKDPKGNLYALKIPNERETSKEWVECQKRTSLLRNQYVGDYQGAIQIPKNIYIGKDFLIEELAIGQEFTDAVYAGLLDKEKRQVAQDFAVFLNYSHQRTLTGKTAAFHPYEKKDFEKIYNYFSPVLTDSEQSELKGEIQKRKNQKEDSEVFTFSDYRAQNMLWDGEKKRLAIIDFENTWPNSVYNEFTPGAAVSSNLSYHFWADVIQHYNKLPKTYPIYIDPERVKTNFFMAIYYEYWYRSRDHISAESVVPELRKSIRQLDAFVSSDTPKASFGHGQQLKESR